MKYSPDSLPSLYRLPWISSPDTAMIEEIVGKYVVDHQGFLLSGPSDSGKKHLLAAAVLANDCTVRWRPQSQLGALVVNSPPNPPVDLHIPPPSRDRRELIAAGRLQIAGVLFDDDFVVSLALRYNGLTPLLGAVQYAIHYALLNRAKLNQVNLNDILWAYDSSAQ